MSCKKQLFIFAFLLTFIPFLSLSHAATAWVTYQYNHHDSNVVTTVALGLSDSTSQAVKNAREYIPNEEVKDSFSVIVVCDGEGYYAEAYDEDDGSDIFGVSCGFDTRDAAIDAAIQECFRQGGTDCRNRRSGYDPNEYREINGMIAYGVEDIWSE